jgi:hypothetical protein
MISKQQRKSHSSAFARGVYLMLPDKRPFRIANVKQQAANTVRIEVRDHSSAQHTRSSFWRSKESWRFNFE